MTHRVRRAAHDQSIMLCAILLIGLLAVSVRPAIGQGIFKLGTSEKMDLGVNAGCTTCDLGVNVGFTGMVTHNNHRPADLVLTAHRIRDGRVVATHRSGSFKVDPGRSFRIDEQYLPAPRFYDGKVAGEIVIAPSPVPLASGGRDVNVWWERLQDRFIADWGESKSISEWQDALLLILAPADHRLRSEAMGHPMFVRLEESPRK